MSDVVERKVADLRVVIERGLCVAFAQCIDVASEAFVIDDDEVVAFDAPERVARQQLIDACRACPVEALTVFDSDGSKLVP